MWEAILVLLVAGLAISRFASIINDLLEPVLPAQIGSTALSGRRIVLWVVAAIFGVIGVSVIGWDPLAATGIASGADQVWNILFVIAATDAADAFFRGRLLRPGAAAEPPAAERPQMAA